MEPFKPESLPPESEVLPLCPAVFVVHSATFVGRKLIVSLAQRAHDDVAYVVPQQPVEGRDAQPCSAGGDGELDFRQL